MKRYYSNYTYIYPDQYLENEVVELDDANNILSVQPFEKELENTKYHQGLLLFVPNTLRVSTHLIDFTKQRFKDIFDIADMGSLDVKAIICNIED